MRSNIGIEQERFLFDHLRQRCGCTKVIEGETAIRQFLELGDLKCADALGIHNPLNPTSMPRFTIAESKGTNIDDAVEQLGNTLAGVLRKFGPRASADLLLLVPRLVTDRDGCLSPGGSYRVDPLRTGRNKFVLLSAGSGTPTVASPIVSRRDKGLQAFSGLLGSHRIIVLVQGASSD